ncbi:hypothetical protein AB1N83_014132, partial [Pleurotus pulmonarius]
MKSKSDVHKQTTRWPLLSRPPPPLSRSARESAQRVDPICNPFLTYFNFREQILSAFFKRFSSSAFSLSTQRQNPFHHSCAHSELLKGVALHLAHTVYKDLEVDTGPHTCNLTGVGLANVRLNQSRRRLLDLLNKLFNTGVQADVDIPQIAVIGAQSAGKSSLIESISGITLPRAAGTCTRCPTECKLSSSATTWSCVVTLRFTTDVNGQTLGQPRTIIFGPAITDKSDVEERIRRAQRAILNPSTSYQTFLNGDDEDLPKSELTFSTNCVTLQISGPDVADLSFCDLPGLIASVGAGGNSNDIQLVESLVTSYISKPSCVILLTVACETDFENQGAHQLAKKHDPHGKRTI